MITKEEVKNYVEKYKDSYSREQIEKQLLSNGAKKEDIDEAYNRSLENESTTKNMLNPKSPFQWLAFIVLIIGGVVAGLIGGVIGGIVAAIIYCLDRKKYSIIKKMLLSILLIFIGIIVYLFIAILLAGVISVNITADSCSRLAGEDADFCYAIAAQNERNESLCNLVLKETGEYNSRDSCYSNMAEILEDSSLCEKIQIIQRESTVGTRDTCYNNLAIVLNDETLCEKIENEEISIVNRDYCYFNVAMNSGNSLLCENISLISDEDVEVLSKELCYASVAIEIADVTLCSKSGIFEQECLDMVKELLY